MKQIGIKEEIMNEIKKKVPEIREAHWLLPADYDVILDDDGSWTISTEMNNYDVSKLRDKVIKSVFVNLVESETYHEDTSMSWVTIHGEIDAD